MFILFWVVVGLTGILLFKNSRYALREYMADSKRLMLIMYFVFLFILAYMVIHITSRLMNLVQQSRELDQNAYNEHPRRPEIAQLP